MSKEIGFLFDIFIAVYLYNEAKKYDKNPFLWGGLGFFFSLLALGIFLIQTDRKGWGILWLAVWCLFVIFLVIAIVAAAALSAMH